MKRADRPKVPIAILLRERTIAANVWIATRLAMGHPVPCPWQRDHGRDLEMRPEEKCRIQGLTRQMKNILRNWTVVAMAFVISGCGREESPDVTTHEKIMKFEEISVSDVSPKREADMVEINGFKISDAKFKRTDEQGIQYFSIGKEDAEFFCTHKKLLLSELDLGDPQSFNAIVSKGSVAVPATSTLWVFLGGRGKVLYAENDICYIFPQDFGAAGGSLIIISKKDGEVAIINYSTPIPDPSLVVRRFARNVSKK